MSTLHITTQGLTTAATTIAAATTAATTTTITTMTITATSAMRISATPTTSAPATASFGSCCCDYLPSTATASTGAGNTTFVAATYSVITAGADSMLEAADTRNRVSEDWADCPARFLSSFLVLC